MLRISRKNFCGYLCTSILASCGTPYVEPQSGTVATLTVVAGAGTRQALVHQLEAGECKNMKLLAIIGPKPTKIAFDELHQVVPEKTIRIPANTPFFTQIHDTRPEYPLETHCTSTASFRPQVGKSYKLVWIFNQTTCQIQILTKNQNSDLWSTEESAKTSSQRCIS